MVGSKTSIQLNSLIYDKLLKIKTYKNSFNEGTIVNFMQIDSEKFGDFLSDSPSCLIIPFQLIFYNYLLFKYFGPCYIGGLISFIILFIIIIIVQIKRKKLQKMHMKAKDNRMKITTQLFNIIKFIKLYNWEKIFYEKVQKKRKIEIDLLKRIAKYNVFINVSHFSAHLLLSLISIIIYNIFNNNMDTANMLTAIYIFGNLGDCIFQLPVFFTGLLEAFVGLERIQKFLYCEDNDDNNVEYLINENDKDNKGNDEVRIDEDVNEKDDNDNYNEKDNNAVEIKNCDFGIDRNTILLKDINISIKKGELIGIIGEVGSGKTSLLNGIINNLEIYNKNNENNNINNNINLINTNTNNNNINNNNNNSKPIKISGKISYVSQTPWILNDTLKNNIILFSPYNESKYKKILEICELNQDIKLLIGGDMTEIGEKGINLSGGQKTRLAIARAIYNESDIYIFDDPLSSLDAYVGKKIFDNVFNDYLKNKSVIISTHAIQYVVNMNRIIYLNNGKIEWMGKSEEILKQNFFKDYLKRKEICKNEEMEKDKKRMEMDNEVIENNQKIL